MQIHSRIAALIFLCIGTQTAWAAAPKILSITGVSNFNLTGTAHVWGGMAGTCTGTGAASDQLCNSCAVASGLTACNEARIQGGVVVSIDIERPADNTAELVAETGTDDGVELDPVNTSNDGEFIQLRWDDICAQMDGTPSDCDAIAAGSTVDVVVRIAFDTDNTGELDNETETTQITFHIAKPDTAADEFEDGESGIKDFKPYPGDAKVFMEGQNGRDLLPDGDFPRLDYSGVDATHLRILAATDGMEHARYNSGKLVTPKDLAIEADGTQLNDRIFDGLDNDTLYFFRIGLVDEARNVTMFVPSAADATAEGCDSGSGTKAQCKWAATPSEVLGLLSDDLNCFIASAAYGTAMQKELGTLRKFRNRVLLDHDWGRALVMKYYKYGPYAARYIHDKPALRAISRAALWPAVGFTKLTFKIGFTNAVLTALALLTLIAAIFHVLFNGIKRRA